MNNISKKKPELVEMGIRLKKLREDKNKSQKETAINLELKQSVLSSYELGNREPPITALNKLARYYGVTVDYLTGNNNYKSSDTQALSSALPFSFKSIDKIIFINSQLGGFLEEILTNGEFFDLLSSLKGYKDSYKFDAMSKDLLMKDKYFNKFEKIVSETGLNFPQFVHKTLIDSAIETMLKNYKNSGKKEI